MQYPIVYVILKRMRAPLILLIVAWTVSILGLTLIPGVEIDGERRYMTVFEAFYFVSYMATTIGFGEPSFGFTDVQRLWVSFSMFLTVISWFYAIGHIISLLQDPALKTVWKRQSFIKDVSRINEKFFIICGYGETGELLLEYLTEKGFQCVVIDNDPERINLLDLNSSVYNTPYIQGDVSDVSVLQMAGLDSPNCRAVLAVTNNEQINVKIAAVAKILHTGVKVICRANSKEAIANAKSFDTDYVINTNKRFAENMSLGFRTPSIQQLTLSLLRRSGRDYSQPPELPKGHWIVCGDDEFAEEMINFLEFEGMDYTAISQQGIASSTRVIGKGTEAITLKSADIEKSVGIVAGTTDDTDNLSIIMTARHLKPNLFFIARQNQDSNREVFRHIEVDTIMESARLFVWQALPLITQPTMVTFLRLARHQDEAWGKAVMDDLRAVSDTVPTSYLIKIDEEHAPAVSQHLELESILRLQDLYVPDRVEERPIALPLMLIRNGQETLLPKMSTPIKMGDTFLMASTEHAKEQVLYTIGHEQDFYYVIHGEEKPISIVMHHIREKVKEYKLRYRQWKKTKRSIQSESNNR